MTTIKSFINLMLILMLINSCSNISKINKTHAQVRCSDLSYFIKEYWVIDKYADKGFRNLSAKLFVQCDCKYIGCTEFELINIFGAPSDTIEKDGIVIFRYIISAPPSFDKKYLNIEIDKNKRIFIKSKIWQIDG